MRARILSCGALVVGLLAIGCGASNPKTSARVSGALTYKGLPLKAAVVQLHDTSGLIFEAQVSSDGTYQASDVPAGELVITVNTESFNTAKTGALGGKEAAIRMKDSGGERQRPPSGQAGAGAATPEAAVATYVKIPGKYSSAKTSPLTVTLKAGRQIHDINITD